MKIKYELTPDYTDYLKKAGTAFSNDELKENRILICPYCGEKFAIRFYKRDCYDDYFFSNKHLTSKNQLGTKNKLSTVNKSTYKKLCETSKKRISLKNPF